MIANASQVRIPCESPVPSRPVPSLYKSPIHRLLTGGLAAGMDGAYGGDPR